MLTCVLAIYKNATDAQAKRRPRTRLRHLRPLTSVVHPGFVLEHYSYIHYATPDITEGHFFVLRHSSSSVAPLVVTQILPPSENVLPPRFKNLTCYLYVRGWLQVPWLESACVCGNREKGKRGEELVRSLLPEHLAENVADL